MFETGVVQLNSIFRVILAITLIAVYEANADCGKNEIYTDCLPCPEGLICPAVCKPGCICAEGFEKNENGECVDKKPRECAPYEILLPCTAHCYVEESCSTLLGEQVLPKCPIIPKHHPCISRCVCKKGLVRKGKECVPPEKCCTEPNEILVDCPAKNDQTCDGRSYNNGESKIKGCRCKPGYVRDGKGRCIKKKNCPVCTGANEVYKTCGTACEPTCEYRSPTCTEQCVEGCFCKEGFIRHKGICIPFKDCPPKCKNTEILNNCSGYCTFDPDCPLIINGIIKDCPPPPLDYQCPARCECKPGLVRIDADCLPPEKCCEDPHEVLVQCPSVCDETCDGKPEPNCKLNPCFRKGCRCKYGYVRDANGLCIKKDKCPHKCEPDEEYKKCIGYCYNDLDCKYLINEIIRDCPRPPPNWKCSPGCVCKKDLVRIDGKCVSPKKCCMDPNEQLVECPSPCDKTCEKSPSSSCKLFPCFKNGCRCKKGYVRNSFGKCIKPKECPSCDGEYEVYQSCGTACEPTCTKRFPICTLQCVPGCFCKDGFIRHNKKCIPISTCPPKCKKTEVLNLCPAYCSFDPTCHSLMKGIIKDCPRPQEIYQCEARCDCKPGLVRLEGECVSPDECCRGPNERAVDCPAPCDDTCEGEADPLCTITPCFKKTCRCKKGYVRHRNGKCTPLKNCPQCKDENEVYKYCGTACQPTCSHRYPACTKQCVEGCFCKEGYIRHNKKCIPIKDCPPICKENEVLNTCVDYCTFDPTCLTLFEGIIRKCPFPIPDYQCPAKCMCKHGLVRLDDKCVSPDECCTGENEVSVNCPSRCDDTCNGKADLNCMLTPCFIKGCRCKGGYIRNDKGVCVRPKECPNICPGPNEEYTECGTCDPTCDHPLRKCRMPCQIGCFCKEGFVRNANGICVKLNECPPKCSEHEVLNLCPAWCTFDQDCLSYLHGYVRDCTTPGPNMPCVPRCECKPGLVRIDGKCLSPEKCCGANETLGDCSSRDRTCDGVAHQPLPCFNSGRVCKCKDGYVRDSKGVCVPPSECVTCKENEVLNTCAAYCTFDPDCLSVFDGIIRDCAAPPEDYVCPVRCDCKPGLVRLDGECVSPNKCCKIENEEAVDCPAPCDESCDSSPELKCQLQPCFLKGCRCKAGYVRFYNRACIPREKCLVKLCKGPNEVYKTCGTCDGTCENPYPNCIQSCIEGCFCKNGYVRNQYNRCIHLKSCCH